MNELFFLVYTNKTESNKINEERTNKFDLHVWVYTLDQKPLTHTILRFN